jgi:hypothetical protein
MRLGGDNLVAMSNGELELMHNVFTEMLEVMDVALCHYQAAMLEPVRANTQHGLIFRFQKQDIHQALVLKLAHVQSTLRAAQVLLKHGHIIQQGALQRIVEETNEDILFLFLAVAKNNVTALHRRYLAEFWAEEFDLTNPNAPHKGRRMIPRREIRAYIEEAERTFGFSSAAHPKEVIYKMESGFVHAASTHIMEIFGGNPPRFHTRGMLGTPRIPGYTWSLWNYMYRGLQSHISVGIAFDMFQLVDQLKAHKKRFESLAGVNYDHANAKASPSVGNADVSRPDSPH